MVAFSIGRILELGTSLVLYSVAAAVVYYIGQLIYNVYFHPLASYPGPLLWRASRLPFCIQTLRGTLPFDVLAHFEKYGPVVRIAPNELAYADGDACREILGHNSKSGGAENGKYQPFYRPDDSSPQDLISADRDLHAQLRRQLAHGFSGSSMRDQEPTITGYIDSLINGLREHAEGGKKPLDMAMWYNFTTFDIIGDLAFGEPFGCLESAKPHPWIEHLFKVTQMGTFIQVFVHYPFLLKLILTNLPASAKETHDNAVDFARKRVEKRIAKGTERRDLIEGLLLKQDEMQLTLEEIVAHAHLLIVGGSETTATLLSGVTYLLVKNPDKLERLTREVRGAFASEEDINIESASKLTYMLACLDEALRMYPPVPVGLPRQVPKGGKTFLGKYVAEGTIVAVWQWATGRYSENYTDSHAYHPERHLPEGREKQFAADKQGAMQPFSYGPRGCLGKNLAYAEMRVILARIIFNFDLALGEGSDQWMEKQIILNQWAKPPLMLHLTARDVKA